MEPITSLPNPRFPSRAKHIQDAVCRALSNHHEDLNRDRSLRFVKITVRLNLKTGEIEGVSVTKDTEEKMGVLP